MCGFSLWLQVAPGTQLWAAEGASSFKAWGWLSALLLRLEEQGINSITSGLLTSYFLPPSASLTISRRRTKQQIGERKQDQAEGVSQ